MKALEKVKDALKRKSKGQNVIDLTIFIITEGIIAIIVVYIISQIYNLIPPNTPFTTAMNYTSLLLRVAIAAPFVPPNCLSVAIVAAKVVNVI